MTNFNLNRLAVLVALVVMLLIAAGAGYSLKISPSGLTFSPSLQVARSASTHEK